KVFEEVERSALRPLPLERFPFFHEGQRVVNRDGHVEVARAYYSVPPEYLTRTVWVRWDARLVRIFNHRFEQIALHVRHEQGRFSRVGQAPPGDTGVTIGRGAAFVALTRVVRQSLTYVTKNIIDAFNWSDANENTKLAYKAEQLWMARLRRFGYLIVSR